jgi:hypothetical protein
MTGIDVARKVTQEGVYAVRLRKDGSGEYDAKPYFTGRKSGWMIVDAFSCSAIVQLHDALSEENRAKYVKLSIQRMADIAFKCCK